MLIVNKEWTICLKKIQQRTPDIKPGPFHQSVNYRKRLTISLIVFVPISWAIGVPIEQWTIQTLADKQTQKTADRNEATT